MEDLKKFKEGYYLFYEDNNIGLVAYEIDGFYEIYEYFREPKLILEEGCFIYKIRNDFDLNQTHLKELYDFNYNQDKESLELVLMSLKDFEEKYPHRAYTRNMLNEGIEKKNEEEVHRCGFCGCTEFFMPFYYKYEGTENGILSKNFIPDETDVIKCNFCLTEVKNPKIILDL